MHPSVVSVCSFESSTNHHWSLPGLRVAEGSLMKRSQCVLSSTEDWFSLKANTACFRKEIGVQGGEGACW